MKAIALCAAGAEKTLANEIKKLSLASGIPYRIIETSYGKIRFETEIKGLYFALIGLRTADRILLQCAYYPACDFDDLFDGAHNTVFEDFIPRDTALVVEKVRTNRSKLAAETSIQSIVHKAIAERLCKKFGLARLPETGSTAKLRVYIEKNNAEILLDLCGDPLHKRGYRIEGGAAPIRETTAAAIILASGWKRKHPLYDPFCGSGTIAIEAALYAFNIAPGLGRRFAIQNLLIANEQAEKEAREFFQQKINYTNIVRIAGSDADHHIIKAAKQNLERAFKLAGPTLPALPHGLPVRFNVLPMQDARTFDEDGFIITNPPYGIRLQNEASAEDNYAQMAILRKNFPGWKMVVVSDQSGFESFFGTKAASCREMTGGAIKFYIYTFEFDKKETRPPQEKTMPVKKNIEIKQKHHYTW